MQGDLAAILVQLVEVALNRLHGPPKESKIRHREGLKGFLPYIRAVYAIVTPGDKAPQGGG